MNCDARANCFVNIYFDLVEIERRKMDAVLRSSKWTAPQVDSVYKVAVRRLGEIEKDYFRSVQRGNNRGELARWNEEVKRVLQVDNFALSGLQN